MTAFVHSAAVLCTFELWQAAVHFVSKGASNEKEFLILRHTLYKRCPNPNLLLNVLFLN